MIVFINILNVFVFHLVFLYLLYTYLLSYIFSKYFFMTFFRKDKMYIRKIYRISGKVSGSKIRL